MAVRRLNENIVNQIAAGEVIERPASVVRELLDNAIDSGASRIEIITANGGKSLIRVTDNGSGMDADDLALAVERHCTSKLTDDLSAIETLGFRGEALPSIGSVARLSIKSRVAYSASGHEIRVEGGHITPAKPAALSGGTIVEVSDLFFATPARLKFLKTDRAEANAVTDVIKRAALGHPHIHFAISGADRMAVDYPAVSGSDNNDTLATKRMEQVLGRDFIDNAMAIDAEREGVQLHGLASLPTYNRNNTLHQFFTVNGRPVRDKQITGAVRGAYMDFLSRFHHPVLCLALKIDPSLVDINVHPAKSEVRFRDAGMVRGLIVGALRQAIAQAGARASSHGGRDMLNAFRTDNRNDIPQPVQTGAQPALNGQAHVIERPRDWEQSPYRPLDQGAPVAGFSETPQAAFEVADIPSGDARGLHYDNSDNQHHKLGAARAQVHENYIVAQTNDGLVIVDQHAAHERLVYEKLKAQLASNTISGQMLLIPDIVEMPEEDVNNLLEHAEGLAEFGLVLESFGPGAVAVRETPAILGQVDCKALLKDLCDEIAEWGSADLVSNKIDAVASRVACHGSIRSGRRLLPQEMDQLLRDMEATPNSGQCNHGRPTFVELKLNDIERLFGRR